MLRRGGWSGKLTVTTNRDEALDGADFVLIQLRVGGQQARLVDETLPNEFGTIGQETTGPGGFAKALRTVPVLLEIAEEVAQRPRRAPGSSTSPTRWASPLARCSTKDTARSACAMWRSACSGASRSTSACPPDDVELEHVGLNHLSWERAIRVEWR